jgi:large subunit ribosomal protein L17
MAALLKNLTTSLVLKDKMETTLAKAKFVKPNVEKLITYANHAIETGDKVKRYNAVKMLNTKLTTNEATKRLLEEVAARFKDIKGGYTRIIKLPNRDGDNAPMARIEFVKLATKKKVATKTKEEKVSEVKDAK